MNTLKQLIERVGDVEFGESIGKTKRSAQSYRLGDRVPPSDVARLILKTYKGRITWSGIYGKVE